MYDESEQTAEDHEYDMIMQSLHSPDSYDTAEMLADDCHFLSKYAGWWDDKDAAELEIALSSGELHPKVFKAIENTLSTKELLTISTKLCLIHSEVSEAMEGQRKDLMDEKLPHRKALEVELADAIIRIFDLAGYMEMDIIGAVKEKLLFNQGRADHKKENREAEGGKKF